MILEDFIIKSNLSNNIKDLTKVFLKYIEQYRYDSFLLGDITPNKLDKESKFNEINNDYPKQWLQGLKEKEFIIVDPFYDCPQKKAQPCSWESLLINDMPPLTSWVSGKTREYKFIKGLAIPIYLNSEKVYGLGLSSQNKEAANDDKSINKLSAASCHFSIIYLNRIEQERIENRILLTTREQEILCWLAIGKTKGETAEILQVSLSCIKRHCENVFIKLGVRNLPSAIAVTMHRQWIKPF